MHFNNLDTIQTTIPFADLLNGQSTWHSGDKNFPLATIKDTSLNLIETNNWLNKEVVEVKSISHAVKILKEVQRNWINTPTLLHRRSSLIQKSLPVIKDKPIKFGSELPNSPLGHWCLLEENLMMYSSACTSKTPNGCYIFEENKVSPPSRAYLKLWEVFTKFNIKIDKQSITLDLGSSPGGWTWVMSELTSHVYSIDKSPLEIKNISKNISFFKEDILQLEWLRFLPKVDWITCDAALSPEKLVPIFLDILKQKPDLKFVCTLKQKGLELSPATIQASKVANTKVACLYNNKHELTWFKI